MSYEIYTGMRTRFVYRLIISLILFSGFFLSSWVAAESYTDDPLLTLENECEKHKSAGPYVPAASGDRFKPAPGVGNTSTDKPGKGLLVKYLQPLSGSPSDRQNQTDTAIEALKTAAAKACLSFGTTFCDQKDSACTVSGGGNQGCNPKNWGQEEDPPLLNANGSPWIPPSPVAGDPSLTLTGLVYCEGGFTCGCGPQS